MIGNCRALSPCGYTAASVPYTMSTPAAMRAREALPLRLGGLDVLAQELFGPLFLASDGVDVIAVVDVHRQRNTVLARQLDCLVIDQRGVLDRVGSREDRLLDRLRAVRMRRDLDAMRVCHVDDGLDFRRASSRARREYRRYASTAPEAMIFN